MTRPSTPFWTRISAKNRFEKAAVTMQMNQHKENAHVGGAAGAASRSIPDDALSGSDAESIGSGENEIPLGVPVSEEEFRRLKEEASSPQRDREEITEQAQEDAGREEHA